MHIFLNINEYMNTCKHTPCKTAVYYKSMAGSRLDDILIFVTFMRGFLGSFVIYSVHRMCFRCFWAVQLMVICSVSPSVSLIQRSVEGKSPRTQDRFSLPTILMTTDPPKSVCGGSLCLRVTTSGSASRPSR